MNPDLVPSLVAMLICITMSAYFSATETAFSSVNKTRLKALAEKGDKRAELTYKLAEDYDRLISTILIGNNVVNISLSSIGTLLFVELLKGADYAATVSTAVITVVVLIFGEITPKSIAKDFPEKFAMFSAPIINMFIWLLTPLNFIFSQWKKLVGKLFKGEEDAGMSQEELLLLVEEVQQEGSIDESEGELLKNAIEFGDLEAQDILTHRVDLEAVPLDATKETVAKAFTESRFSRLLVYEDSIDKIVGVIHQKDFYSGTGTVDAPLKEIMTEPLYIHQTEKVDDLLQLLRTNKSHMAIVIDEYGGTLGIVTMEDILEELVGEIWDEHDEVEEPIQQVNESTFIVDGSVTLDDFCDRFDIESDSDSVSLGGWVMDQMECIPDQGDSFEYENLTITVSKTDDHRVESVTVTINPSEEEDKEN
ncbi:MAG: HlyC/CorC family transporter [Oscillospiraceae bacterium]|nr:HlyC/CorC family transporter [Oscillospiraceae bacterium]